MEDLNPPMINVMDSMEYHLKSCQEDSNCSTPSDWDWTTSRVTCNGDLLKTGFLSDLTIYIGKQLEEVKVHRLILQAASPIFYQIFQKNPKLGKLAMTDVDCSAFKIFLEHLYSCLGSHLIRIENAQPVLAIATKFQVQELVGKCSECLKANINEENVCKLLQQGMDYGNKDLVASALSYVSQKAWTIIDKQDFLELSLDCVYEIAQRDDLRIRSEIQLFNSVLRWGEAECKRAGMDATSSTTCGGDETNLTKKIQKLIPLIRFPLMDEKEFIKIVLTKQILSMEDGFAIMCLQRIPFDERASLQGIRGMAKFNAKPRNYYKPKLFSAHRFIDNCNYNCINSPGDWDNELNQNVEKLNVKVNGNVSLVGVKFNKKNFSVWGNDLEYGYTNLNIDEITWDMFGAKIIIQETIGERKILFQREIKPFVPQKMEEILFEAAVHTQPEVEYTVQVAFSGMLVYQETLCQEGEYTVAGAENCAAEVRVNVGVESDDTCALKEVIFSFSRPSNYGHSIPIDYGFISELLFHHF